MAIPPFVDWPWWRVITKTHPGRSVDEIPPPAGYDSWGAYITAKGIGMTTFDPLGPPAPEGNKLAMVWTRDDEDVAVCGMHFVHADGSDTIAFTEANRIAIEARADTLWDSIKPYFETKLELARYEWHDFGVGVRRPNPHVREKVFTPVPGTADADTMLPPQIALSVTFKTDFRRTWGRVYLPGLATVALDGATGRIDATAQAAVRTAFGTFADGVKGDSLPLVVWSPRHDGGALQYGTAAHAADLDLPDTTSYAKTVDVIQVDDVWDVIRSRRWDRPLSKLTHTVA